MNKEIKKQVSFKDFFVVAFIMFLLNDVFLLFGIWKEYLLCVGFGITGGTALTFYLLFDNTGGM